eukprot:13534883-Ditylum_brightwellii.AAC.1
MSAVVGSMQGVSMNCSDDVTAIQNSSGQICLFGIMRGVHLPSLTDDEAVVNAHFICEEGWQVDEVAKCHRGSQSVWFPNGDELPLEYDASKYHFF